MVTGIDASSTGGTEEFLSTLARQFAQGVIPGLPSVPATTESNFDFNFDIGDAFLSMSQQRGVDAPSGTLTGFYGNTDDSREFSLLESIRLHNLDLPGDSFSNFAESFQDPGNDDLGGEPSPTDVVLENAASGEPQQVLDSALHRGSFEDVAEPGPQRNLLDVNVEACISTALMSSSLAKDCQGCL